MTSYGIKEVPLLRGHEVFGTLHLQLEENQMECQIQCSSKYLPKSTYTGSDFFRAFGELRNDLKVKSIFPAVYGAHVNVFPGGLSSDSSSGLMAYQFTKTGGKMLVDIFERVSPSEYDYLSDFDEQKKMRKQAIRASGTRI